MTEYRIKPQKNKSKKWGFRLFRTEKGQLVYKQVYHVDMARLCHNGHKENGRFYAMKILDKQKVRNLYFGPRV